MSALARNIEKLSKLEDDWDGRGSSAPSDAALNTARCVCAVPLGSGGLQIELHAGRIDLEMEVDALGNVTSVYWAPNFR